MISKEDAEKHKRADSDFSVSFPVCKCFFCGKEFKQEHVILLCETFADACGDVYVECADSWVSQDDLRNFKEVAFHKDCFRKVAGEEWLFE